jgi:hypothetical protein
VLGQATLTTSFTTVVAINSVPQIVKHLSFANYSGVEVGITVALCDQFSSGALGKKLLGGAKIPANSTLNWGGDSNIIVPAGWKIDAVADVANSLDMTAFGIKVTAE